MIGNIINRHLDVLTAMMKNEAYQNEKVFNYLYDLFPILPEEQLEALKFLMKKNIKLFTKINENETCDILSKYFINEIDIFIADLEDFPYQQIKLIHGLLKLENYDQKVNYLKKKYLELLARTGQGAKILNELEKESYPLDESLKVCEEYGIMDGEAYLLVKSGGEGNLSQAIKIYFTIISKQIYPWMVREDEVVVEEIILRRMKKCTDVCQEMDLRHHRHYENEWFIIIEQIQRLKKHIYNTYDSYISDRTRSIINQKAYPQLLALLITAVSHDQIIYYLQSSINTFDLEAFQIIIEEMVKTYVFEKLMLRLTQEVYISTRYKEWNQLVSAEKKGFLSEGCCHDCGLKNTDIMIHYACGHQIHPYCGKDVKQCIICAEEIDQMYQRKIDTLNKISIELYSNEDLPEVNPQTQIKKNRLQKFKDFDQNSPSLY